MGGVHQEPRYDLDPMSVSNFIIGKWAINKPFKLQGNPELIAEYKAQDFGDVYVQVKFVEAGMIDDHQEPEYLDEIEIYGNLFINVIFGKGLRPADGRTSDPYVEIFLPNKNKLTTKTINKTLNPVWNHKEKAPLRIPLEVI